MTTKREFQERQHYFNALQSLGISYQDCDKLRLISVRLRSWFERECGTDNGCIERDENTQKTYWLNSHSGKRYPIRDMETGCYKRLAAVMAQYPTLKSYIQGDCRGAALYILRPGDVPEGQDAGGYYSRGICVF